MHLNAGVDANVDVDASTGADVGVSCIHVYTLKITCARMYVHMCAYSCLQVYNSAGTHAHTSVHTCKCTWTCTLTCIYIYMYMCICRRIFILAARSAPKHRVEVGPAAQGSGGAECLPCPAGETNSVNKQYCRAWRSLPCRPSELDDP